MPYTLVVFFLSAFHWSCDRQLFTGNVQRSITHLKTTHLCDAYVVVHTADTDKTRMPYAVNAGGVNRTSDESRLSATGDFETEHVQFFCSFVQCRNVVWIGLVCEWIHTAVGTGQYVKDYWKPIEMSPTLFTPLTRQDSLVMSVSRWCEQGIRLIVIWPMSSQHCCQQW